MRSGELLGELGCSLAGWRPASTVAARSNSCTKMNRCVPAWEHYACRYCRYCRYRPHPTPPHPPLSLILVMGVTHPCHGVIYPYCLPPSGHGYTYMYARGARTCTRTDRRSHLWLLHCHRNGACTS